MAGIGPRKGKIMVLPAHHGEEYATRRDLADTEDRLKTYVKLRLNKAENRIIRETNKHTDRKIDELADKIHRWLT